MKKSLLVIPSLFTMVLSACGKATYAVKDYTMEFEIDDSKTELRLLQLTDLHIGDKDNFETHKKFLDLIIDDEKTKADFIVVTGDLFTFASKTTAYRLFDYFDSKNIPWTVTFGNHDEQCYFSATWLVDTLAAYAKKENHLCYFNDIQDKDDVDGFANFAINVHNTANTFKEQLIVMDSNRYKFAPIVEYVGYDYFHQNQIDWYTRLVTTSKNEGYTHSLMFYHIPLPEINKAREEAAKDPSMFELPSLNADVNEKACPPDEDLNFFKTISMLGSTKGMYFGHDHYNDFIIKYGGIDFGYGLKSTDRVYYDDSMLGGRLIKVTTSTHDIAYENIVHTYEEVK